MSRLVNDVHSHILDISDLPDCDESIKRFIYTEIPLQSKANINTPSQTITFNIISQNTIFFPSESYLRFEGRIVKRDGTAYTENDEITLINNAMMYLFTAIKYKLGTVDLETISAPGQTTSMLGYLSLPDDFSTSSGLKSCWSKDTTDNANSAKYKPITATQASAAGGFTPSENDKYNQGFAARKALIFSSDPIGSFEFVIPLCHIFGFARYDRII